MKAIKGNGKSASVKFLSIISLLLALIWIDSARAEGERPLTIAGLSQSEALRLGERIYRKGLLSSGEPVQAVVKGDIPVAGTAFTCISCHLRSGLGSYEGEVLTPPTDGSNLFRPKKKSYKVVEASSASPSRPAYTDESLAEALQFGIDPAGRTLKDVMPRYILEEKDLAILIFYLKSLSSQFSPGVSDTTIRFATVITDDVTPEERDAMLVPLENYIKRNGTVTAYETGEARLSESELLANRIAYRQLSSVKRLSLSRWLLKGSPDTWLAQLEEYYRKEPVFALLGGITKGEWQPIHRFSEDHRIPCILPITEFPVISETDWYTLYFSKGFYQEGEAAARYLNNIYDSLKNKSIVQIVRDSREGRALSAGFQERWLGLGHPEPATITLKDGETLTRKVLHQRLASDKPVALIIWDGPDALPVLETISSERNRPEIVIISSGYLGNNIWTLKEQIRDFTYITYPFRLPQAEIQYQAIASLMLKKEVHGDAQMIVKQLYIITRVLSQMLKDMSGQYYRDNFLDVIGMNRNPDSMIMLKGAATGTGMGVALDETYPLYERLSFGPDQRYASKGCYIVQLSKGPKPELIRKSDWVIY